MAVLAAVRRIILTEFSFLVMFRHSKFTGPGHRGKEFGSSWEAGRLRY